MQMQSSKPKEREIQNPVQEPPKHKHINDPELVFSRKTKIHHSNKELDELSKKESTYQKLSAKKPFTTPAKYTKSLSVFLRRTKEALSTEPAISNNPHKTEDNKNQTFTQKP